MDFVKKPCKHCPFRRDVKPYLHPERAAEIAYLSQSRYSNFDCHKTTVYDDDLEDQISTENSLTCAGFLTLRAQGGERTPKDFEPSWEMCYSDENEMIEAYEEEWEK